MIGYYLVYYVYSVVMCIYACLGHNHGLIACNCHVVITTSQSSMDNDTAIGPLTPKM